MSVYPVRLPDVGEGVAEAELVVWLVQVGDRVTTESALAEVLTDKATVEVSSPVAGVVVALHGNPGDRLAVGSELVLIEQEGEPDRGSRAAPPVPTVPAEPVAESSPPAAEPSNDRPATPAGSPRRGGQAAPAVRRRAAALGIELATVAGSGPEGRVLHEDLDRLLVAGTRVVTPSGPAATRIVPVRGLRRKISERLAQAWREIPHITYVDEVDATQLETVRRELNAGPAGGDRLTVLPFLIRAVVIACREQPHLNAHFDAAAEQLTVFDAVHVGVATQTPNGLVVPVVRNAHASGLWALAGEIDRLARAARDGRATAAELTGSTITITSLGALGGLVTTPIINQPEVAVIGVNRMETRPVWRDGAVVPRLMFNLSSSFDHRIVDGWDAATFVQRVKALLESPALLFIERDA